jgi:hypothetical protein
MSFLNNHKEAQISEKKLYTGICPVELVAINPSVEELKALYNSDKVVEPVYTSTSDEGNKKVRLDFFIRNTDLDLITKFAIFLENKVNVSTTGKTQFINERIQSMYAESLDSITSNPKLTWFDIKTARPAKVGEVQLYEFLVKLTNASTDETSNLKLENFDNLFNGNVEELKEINSKLGKGVKVLLGVKDGIYQDVYNRYFQRIQVNGTDTMTKNATSEYGGFNSDYQNSMELQEYSQAPMPEKDTVYDNSSDANVTKSMF